MMNVVYTSVAPSSRRVCREVHNVAVEPDSAEWRRKKNNAAECLEITYSMTEIYSSPMIDAFLI